MYQIYLKINTLTYKRIMDLFLDLNLFQFLSINLNLTITLKKCILIMK